MAEDEIMIEDDAIALEDTDDSVEFDAVAFDLYLLLYPIHLLMHYFLFVNH